MTIDITCPVWAWSNIYLSANITVRCYTVDERARSLTGCRHAPSTDAVSASSDAVLLLMLKSTGRETHATTRADRQPRRGRGSQQLLQHAPSRMSAEMRRRAWSGWIDIRRRGWGWGGRQSAGYSLSLTATSLCSSDLMVITCFAVD